ncbi:MAG: class II aldolase/adducin family protein [gamma proteobacterium symbiont of Bathyaustriella thionipta]|nr:class II aldolase/adducin family protein [gamma proteobacterium symbiont of Bathyaustriella thionipta]
MNQQDGVIKYQLQFSEYALHAEQMPFFARLNEWRQILFRHDLIGCHADRYEGAGYGNISHRIGNSREFLISGTQSGHLQTLQARHYARVTAVDCRHNQVQAQGQIEPSSEALTHDAVYQVDAQIRCVMHVHDPLLWGCAEALALPSTAATIEYGTPQMAVAVAQAVAEGCQRGVQLIAMKGHLDGIISYAESTYRAGEILLDMRRSGVALTFS